MAASSEDKDYIHLIKSYLEESTETCLNAANFADWETHGQDRSEFLSLLDGYLDIRIDLITIQLGENAGDIATFKEDFKELLNYISLRCPKAQIIVFGDFWSYENRDELKKDACNESGVTYVSLDDIKNNPEYQASLNTIVYDKDGNEHIIEHEGVAAHPGDKGIEYIADKVIDALKQSDNEIY